MKSFFFRSCYSTCYKRLSVREALSNSTTINKNIKVLGWVQSVRKQRSNIFIDINDGSCLKNLQAVSSTDAVELKSCDLTLGTSVQLEGTLVSSSHPMQPVELVVTSVNILGGCDTHLYPFKARTKHSLDYIRQFPHLRSRTKTFSSVLRVRNTASLALHDYFQSQGFIQIHTPLLTSSDCEGAGDLFKVLPAEADQTKTDSDSFFNVPAYLTVSGQLHAETMACGLSKVYTFGPAFRAERSHTSRHLAEFYMVEAEMVTEAEKPEESLELIMKCSEEMCKAVMDRVLCSNEDDVNFLHSILSEGKDLKLHRMIENPYGRITYKEAMEILIHADGKESFEFKPEIGGALGSEHERYLVKHFEGTPVFVTDFPAVQKPFYARVIKENDTALAMDLLMPGVGEVIGGSVREERPTVLQDKLQRMGMEDDYQWYLDLRRFGTVPHGGFGLGFERLLQVILGIENIRDVIPYPRYLGSCRV